MIRARSSHALQLCARSATHGHARRARQLEQLMQTRLVRALCYRHALDATIPRAQSFDDRQHAVQLRV
jgi:hypothetical protein